VKRILPAVLLTLAAGSGGAQATGYAPLALTLPASARALGMGNIAVAGRDDDVIFYNPAQLVVARGTSMSIARTSEIARGATLSTVTRVGPAGIGFGINYLEYQTSGVSYPVTREDILDRNAAVGSSVLGSVGYAQVFHRFRLGASANYAVDAVSLERFSNVYADLGVARDFGRYSSALAVQHLGPSIQRGGADIDPPVTATLGVATSRQLGPLDLLATTAVSATEEKVFGGLGAEIGWSWISGYSIAGRGGIHQPNAAGIADRTAGFGFTADRLTIDLAAELLDRGRVSYRAGLRIR
jgi:hypothetical protein